ncbi:hypothetical protein DEA8626_01043 [Defluviimonas aquaemixtae]|uniref:Uncharacterized protein n=1 Tax=Albidovulum aquaemixtae TaxID=1542388 RepID=A0A2R8B4S1_9RHOB|nr:hypothetical protein DEA8626_01043 [Defluviimonas aquaemixtae]
MEATVAEAEIDRELSSAASSLLAARWRLATGIVMGHDPGGQADTLRPAPSGGPQRFGSVSAWRWTRWRR